MSSFAQLDDQERKKVEIETQKRERERESSSRWCSSRVVSKRNQEDVV